jgi:glycosyltransferase involved in cell wall biosynthesis
MKDSAIFIPTYKRPTELERVINNIHENTQGSYEVYFIVEPEDAQTILCLTALHQNIIYNKHKPCYAGSINTAYEETQEPFFFCGADDLEFHPGWLQAIMDMFSRNSHIAVIGTNDLHSSDVLDGTHATHYMVKRSYIQEQGGTVDGPDKVFHEYKHYWCDKELTQTARARGVFMPCLDSKVEHLHPAWDKGTWDETYLKGLSTMMEDNLEYAKREHLWQKS